MNNRIEVLDAGYVEVYKIADTDRDIANSARISTGGEAHESDEKNYKLIKYMVEHKHTSPIEACDVWLKISMPLVYMRQWYRTRTARPNEASGRYIKLEESYYCPNIDRMNLQSDSMKQGSSPEILKNAKALRNKMLSHFEKGMKLYSELIDSGLAKETARLVIPYTTYTTFLWKIDLNNLTQMLITRLDSHAQWETRQYAKAVWFVLQEYYPLYCKALKEIYPEVFNQPEEKFVTKVADSKPPTKDERFVSKFKSDYPGITDKNWEEIIKFVTYRREKGKPVDSKTSMTMLLNKVVKMQATGQDVREATERAIESGWSSIFPLQKNNNYATSFADESGTVEKQLDIAEAKIREYLLTYNLALKKLSIAMSPAAKHRFEDDVTRIASCITNILSEIKGDNLENFVGRFGEELDSFVGIKR